MNVTEKTQFCGKVAIVTGAAQGIGHGIVELLAEQGACVVALDKNFKDELNFPEQGRGAGPVFKHKLDVTDRNACSKCFEDIVKDHGEIHYVVHAAGILKLGSVISCCIEDWEECLRVNVLGSLNILAESAFRMKEQKKGAIVLVGSNASSTPRQNMGAYAASKAAASQMAKCLALEVAEYGVRCNILAPGSTDTPMQNQFCKNEKDKAKVISGDPSSYRLGIPLKKIASTKQIAEVALFLLSDQSSHITMEVVRVDGGATLGSI